MTNRHSASNSHDHAASYYAATANQPLEFAPLQGEQSADVCIVGGGFSGLNTAIELAERGFSVVLLEAHRIGWGASGRNGGQLIRGVGHDVEQFQPVLGDRGVDDLKRMGFEAVDIVRERIERYAIQCDLTWGYCDLATKQRHLDGFEADYADLQRLGYPHPLRRVPKEAMREVIGSDRYVGGLIDMGSGHLHPLNLALGEAAAAQSLGVRLYERSAVKRIDYGPQVRVHTAQGSVRADQLVLAGNAYLGSLNKSLAGKVLPAGSYIIATEPLPEEVRQELLPQNMAVCDQRVALDYFRLSADSRLLFGGACHYSGRDPKDIAAYMQPKMLEVFPRLRNTRIDFQWGGMIGIGANRLPQIGRLPDQPNVYFAQAYAGHGLNATHLAGRLLAEAISGQLEGRFDLFSRVPHPTFPGGQRLRSPLLALGMLWHRLKDEF
ncbi:MAG: FAD-binding oxidoreductase [Gammaproteobacteria bacterium]|uniref:NAD(P)/FAD-dependent oxidoreductase n=1 Tax=Stutzerimonas xanthomarina TaxID=271420 RepID=UPI00190B67BB|nr:FAD-binding oxidoreductase [Stutzerimonas xanthomarina]MBU0811063.1 FAD-binding oxidoreductase [Gammaproteobacteria bacterium]MBK3844937.1 FAD-dependent oxidoreductase [Stutzerimonas xanthomarina]MBU0852441.1 FAD-binding oxidoreductase [Gammaproteobacteria bacterium]MBU1302937.1 FAD-binding oxidoreductase [Gammaproteobacteria bacterium]MBU1459515.1 FAD-binding oxidoreductase [Gammaproteobacteria bacterium]|tara:strand:+ start:9682 stop:10992 length:1311 start_codon:yes stop_codon:yes gene_type:complete